MDYSILSPQDKEVVSRRLQRRILTDIDAYDESKYEEYCKEYLSDEQKDHYVIRTRWSVTSSKLKCFINNPEEYYMRYVLELPEPSQKEKKCFTIGNAFETLVSDWLEWFDKKFYVDKWYLKDELAERLSNWDPDVKKLLMKSSVDSLRSQYYKEWDRIRLTPAEGRDIIAMRYECQRQPIFEMGSPEYQNQVYFEAQYLSLKLTGTLDRYGKDVQKIRDWKTAGQMDRFEEKMEYELDYITNMAFYFALVYVVDWSECDVLLDVQESVAPYRSEVYRLSAKRLKQRMVDFIKPALASLDRCHKENERPSCDRETAFKSVYYPIMKSGIIHQAIQS